MDSTYMGKNLPSFQKKHIKNRRKIKKAITEIELKHNWAWYDEIYFRWEKSLDKVAILFRGHEITGREMFESADKLVYALKAKGIKKGDEILACMANCPEAIYLLLAASKCGAIVNFWSSGFDKDFISEIIEKSNSKILFVTSDEWDNIKKISICEKIDIKIIIPLNEALKIENLDACYGREHLKKITDVYAHGKTTITFLDFINNIKDNRRFKIDKINLDDPFTITYTSGSTKIGLPKAIVHKNRAYIAIARFHDPDLSRMPAMKNMRGLAHIPLHSNTNIASAISDTLCQRGTVVCEPIYEANSFAKILALNKASFVLATRSFWIAAMKEFEENEKLAREAIPYLIVAASVGEDITQNEEKYINRILKKYKAGSAKLPFPLSPVTLSIGGGDCEHGGLFFTLFREQRECLGFNKKEFGLIPFQLADIAVLDGDGRECAYGKYGRLVANSPCTMKEYKDNVDANNEFYIKDIYGRCWGDCHVWAYITRKGNVVIRGRLGNEFKLKNGGKIPMFKITEVITKTSKHILSCETVLAHREGAEIIVSYIELMPHTKILEKDLVRKIKKQCKKEVSDEILKKMYFTIIPMGSTYELTKSGKRNIRVLELKQTDNCNKLY